MNILGNPNPHLLGAPFVRTAMFRAFKAAVGTYVKGGTVTLSASEPFEVEAIASSYDSVSLALFELASPTTNHFICVRQNNGNLKVASYGKTPGDSGVDHQLNRFSRVSLVWDTVQFHLYENDSLLYSVIPSDTEWLNDEFVFYMGHSPDTNMYFEGTPCLYRIWTGGDRSTGTEVLRYRNFCRPDRIVPNELATLGAELAHGGFGAPSSYDTVVSELSVKSFSYEGGINSQTRIFNAYDVTPGETYLFSCALDSADIPMTLYAREGANGGGTILKTAALPIGDKAVFPVTATTSTLSILWVANQAGATGVVSAVSLCEAPGYGTLHNPAEGSVQRYTKKGQAWLGEELLGNSGFDSWVDDDPEEWRVVSETAESYITEASNGARMVSDGSYISLKQTVLDIGKLYRSVVSLPVVDDGKLIFYNGTGNVGQYLESGVFTEDFEATGTFAEYKRGGTADLVLAKASLKHRIPIAEGAA